MAIPANAGAREVEKSFEIAREDLKHGREIREEIQQVVDNTNWFTQNLFINFHQAATGSVRFCVRGHPNDVELGCNLLQRRLKINFEADNLPPGVALLTTANLKRHDRADVSKRQFACEPCDSVWWSCLQRYKAIPRHLEYGWALHRCQNCGREFYGKTVQGRRSPCHSCGTLCLPERFGDRLDPDRQRGRGRHSCEECNYGLITPCPAYRRVIVASEPHVSTGSTADTFLTQMSLMSIAP
eukprot:gene17634-19388_t